MIKFIIRLVIIFSVAFALWFLTVLISDNKQETTSFVIDSGQGLNEVSQQLYDDDLIQSKFVFETWAWLKRVDSQIVAGTHSLPANSSIKNILQLVTSVPKDNQSTITIVEGWSRNWPKLKETLEQAGFSYQEFLNLTASKKDWEEQYEFLQDAPSNASLEGYLFPNTHFIDTQTTIEDLVTKLLDDFDNKLDEELRAEITKQGKTIFEVITLASIIEREVPNDEDKKMIADIFLKRLEANIGLQSDATINFVTGKGLAQPTLEDLQINSPYNTYKYRGLPPGPISNPGLASIKAVIYPTSNPYYYFLTTLDDGTVIYSTTHEEHVANKQKYLK